MSQYKDDVVATEVVYFWFAANLTTGAAGDGATPLYDVRLAGAAASAAPTASGTPTLLTHANYTDGLHEIAVDTTGYANGEYAVFCTLTISTVNPAGFVGSFRVRTANRIDAIKTKTDFLPSVTAGNAGGLFIAGTNAATTVTTSFTTTFTGNLTGSVASVTGAVGSVTGNVGGNVVGSVGSVAGAVGSVTGAVGSVTGAVGSVTGNVGGNVVGSVGSVVGDTKQTADVATLIATVGVAGAGLTAADDAVLAAIAALNNLSAAQVNAEVVDALATDTYAEPTGVPAATASIASKIGRLHQALRNAVTVTATKKQFFDDANAALWEKDLADDGATFSESEGNSP